MKIVLYKRRRSPD